MVLGMLVSINIVQCSLYQLGSSHTRWYMKCAHDVPCQLQWSHGLLSVIRRRCKRNILCATWLLPENLKIYEAYNVLLRFQQLRPFQNLQLHPHFLTPNHVLLVDWYMEYIQFALDKNIFLIKAIEYCWSISLLLNFHHSHAYWRLSIIINPVSITK